MGLSESFNTMFDKAAIRGHAKQTNNIWTVTEYKADASMTHLNVLSNGVFTGFDHGLVKGIKDTTSIMSSHLEDKDCDGIAFLTDDKEKEHIIFAELKSGFDTLKITGAFHQITMSFVKMHSWLSLCKQYTINDIRLHFIVACKCFKDENQRDNIMLRISQARQLGENTFETKFLWPLLKNNHITVKLSELRDINKLPFHENINDKEITMYLQLTEYPTDNQTEVNLA